MTEDVDQGSDDHSVRMRLRLCRRAAVAYAAANGHRVGQFNRYGVAECPYCGAILDEYDAVAFVQDCAVFGLGSLSAPCPRSWADR